MVGWGFFWRGGACLSQIELSTSQVFSVCVFQFRKLIPFLFLPLYSQMLCAGGREEEMMEFSVTVGLDSDGHWFIVERLDYNRLFIASAHLSSVKVLLC